MGREWLGRLQVGVARLAHEARGQGTIEYVGLVLLMAVVLAALVAGAHQFTGDASIPQAIVKKIKGAIDAIADGG
jgi:hypothetical protein